ncbi:MAG TPA: ferritin-like domain-containing protein, partial [Solirubrobacterales bacterium]|nr:ferritin-like domain-containing protein [Solirubrobacterales bacterium]
IKTAVALENTGVGAYSGQVLNITNPAYVAAAASILTVEARHASVAGLLLKPISKNLSPDGAFDKPKTAAQVLKAVEATGFLQ